jgi:hypothetical protein
VARLAAVMVAASATALPYWHRVNATHGFVCVREWGALSQPQGVPLTLGSTVGRAVFVPSGGGATACAPVRVVAPGRGAPPGLLNLPYVLGGTTPVVGVLRWAGPGATQIRLACIGDGGWGSSAQAGVVQGLVAFARRTRVPVDGLVFTGDNAYMTGSLTDYKARFFPAYTGIMGGAATLAVLGNHDVRADAGATWGRLFRAGPGNAAGPGPRYYLSSWGAGPGGRPLVWVIVLDSSTAQVLAARGPQATWLAATLSAAKRASPVWLVAVAHHPTHGPRASQPSNTAMRTVVLPLLVAGGVHVLVTGHEHTYLRGGGAPGLLHVVSGTGGAPLLARAPVAAPYTTGNAVFSSLVLDIGHSRLQVSQVNAAGAVVDTFALS